MKTFSTIWQNLQLNKGRELMLNPIQHLEKILIPLKKLSTLWNISQEIFFSWKKSQFWMKVNYPLVFFLYLVVTQMLSLFNLSTINFFKLVWKNKYLKTFVFKYFTQGLHARKVFRLVTIVTSRKSKISIALWGDPRDLLSASHAGTNLTCLMMEVFSL